MNYVRKVTDLDTGEVRWLALGNHRPVSEVASDFELGPKKFREALVAMGLLQVEFDEASGCHRRRLTPFAIGNGFGYRIDRIFLAEKVTPFDVLSELGVEYIRDHLPAALQTLADTVEGPLLDARNALQAYEKWREEGAMRPLDNEGRVRWLRDRFPSLSGDNIVSVLDIPRRTVFRYASRQEKQRKRGLADPTIALPPDRPVPSGPL